MIKPLRKSSKTVESNIIVSKEGEHELLRSSKVDRCSPSLDFKSNSPLVSKDMQLDYLASILVDIFLEQKKYERSKTGSDILPGLNKRTS